MSLKVYADIPNDRQALAQLERTLELWTQALEADKSPIWMACEICGGPVGSRPHCQHAATKDLVAS